MIRAIKRFFYRLRFAYYIFKQPSVYKKAGIIRENLVLRTGIEPYRTGYRRAFMNFRKKHKIDCLTWDMLINTSAHSILGTPAEDNETLRDQTLELASLCADLFIMLSEQKVDHKGMPKPEEEEPEDEDRTKDTA